jgi:succinoglycan biosynthesis transport protein ExoP
MTFGETVHLLLRRKLLIATTTFLGLALAVAYRYLATQEYESFARVLVVSKDPAMASATQETVGGTKPEISEDVLATHRQILKSDAIVQRALKTSLLPLASIEPRLRAGQGLSDYILERMWTLPGSNDAKTARTIDIGFRHSNADDCRRVVDAVVVAYRNFLAEQFQDANGQAASLISRAEGELEKEIATLESEHLALRKQGPVRSNRGGSGGNVHEDAFADMQRKISELRMRLADANGRLRAIEGQKSQGGDSLKGMQQLAMIGGDDTARLSVFTEMMRAPATQPAFLAQQPLIAEVAKAEYERLVALQAQYKTLQQDFGSKHPEVMAKRNEISALEETIEKYKPDVDKYKKAKDVDAADILAAYKAALKSDVGVMKERLSELNSMASQEEAKSKELVNFDLNENIIGSRIERKQRLYDAVVSRLHNVNLQGSYGSFINEVLIPAKTGRHVWPSLSICGFAGTSIGMLLGMLIAIGMYFTNPRYRSMEELNGTLSVAVVAAVPRLEAPRRSRDQATAAEAQRAGWSRQLEMHFANRSAAADAIRGLRNAVLLSGDTSRHTLLLVTSPNAGDGKSIVAANLALSLAQAGRSVLLVDANLANPALHVVFGLGTRKGLAEILEKGVEPLDAVIELETHLRFLPAGLAENSPADAFHSAHFTELCGLLAQKFEYVVFDGPAVLGSSDACVLAAAMDQVLMVTRPSRNRRDELIRAASEIERHGRNLIGLVANCWDIRLKSFLDSNRGAPFREAPVATLGSAVGGADYREATNFAFVNGRPGKSATERS